MNVAIIGRNRLRTTSLHRYSTAWACIMGDRPTKGYRFHTYERQCRRSAFCTSNWSWGYRTEARPDHGYQVKMEGMGEQGAPVRHCCPERRLFARVSHGTADRSRDAHAGEV